MTPKQLAFADEYLIDCNATRAYKAAYPRIKSDAAARACGSRLLADDNVRAYIDARLAEMSSARIAESREVLEYLTSAMRGEHAPMTDPPEARDRIRAAELLGKRYGMFVERVTATVETRVDSLASILAQLSSDEP